MRPRTFNNPSNSNNRRCENDYENEDITHDERAMNLIAKLLNEQKSPTKLKV